MFRYLLMLGFGQEHGLLRTGGHQRAHSCVEMVRPMTSPRGNDFVRLSESKPNHQTSAYDGVPRVGNRL